MTQPKVHNSSSTLLFGMFPKPSTMACHAMACHAMAVPCHGMAFHDARWVSVKLTHVGLPDPCACLFLGTYQIIPIEHSGRGAVDRELVYIPGIVTNCIQHWTSVQIQICFVNDVFNRADSAIRFCKMCLAVCLPQSKKLSKTTSTFYKMTSDIATNDQIMPPSQSENYHKPTKHQQKIF